MVANMGAALTAAGSTLSAHFHIQPTQKKVQARKEMSFLRRLQSLGLHVAALARLVTPVNLKRYGAPALGHSASTASDAA